MEIETFFEKFDVFVEAPNAVGKLRDIILSLALTGKLSDQNFNDETAEVLFFRIREIAAKRQSKNEIKLHKTKKSTENLFESIPDSWKKVQLGQVTFIRTGKLDANASSENGQYPFFTCAKEPLKIDSFTYDLSCVLIAGNGNFDVNQYSGKFDAYQRTYIVEPISPDVSVEFLFHYMQRYSDILKKKSLGGVISYIKIGFLTDAPFPLPPLAEQKRIVAKVEQLMGWCDRLEQQQQERAAQQQHLARAAVAQVQAEPTPKHLEALFHKSYDITPADLRKTILTLAVQGKLVEQDDDDEPASTSIKTVRKHVRDAIAASIIKKDAGNVAFDDSKLQDLPSGWRWTRLVEITEPKPYAIKRGPFGSAIRKDMFVESGYKIYEQKHAIYGDFSKGSYYINKKKFQELSAFELHPSEILISCSGTVGKLAIVPEGIERGIINQALLKLSLDQSALLNEYFLILFPAYFMETDTLTDLAGTAQKNIPGVKILKAMPFPLPPLAEQKRIVAKVDRLMARVDALEAHLAATDHTAQQLLDALVHELTAAPA